MEEKQQYSLISEALPKALFVFLKILFYFIVLPYKIWKASTLRLAHISNDPLLNDEEEFPVYTIAKIGYDALIVFLPILGIVLGILLATMFGGGYDYYYDQYSTGMGFRSFITTFIVSYFVIPLFSFIKEILTITLSMVHSLKEIEKNTQNFDESTRALL
tara:strand:- start:49 stop:528 length:480 start_codon:yes stop_codon:yes gene_type:complete